MTRQHYVRHALPINFQFFLKLGDGYKITSQNSKAQNYYFPKFCKFQKLEN